SPGHVPASSSRFLRLPRTSDCPVVSGRRLGDNRLRCALCEASRGRAVGRWAGGDEMRFPYAVLSVLVGGMLLGDAKPVAAYTAALTGPCPAGVFPPVQ